MTAVSLRFAPLVFATLLILGTSFSSAMAQGYEGCPGGGVAPQADYYLPNLYSFVVQSDERRDAEQLAATFPDPADALTRLYAYCWTGQAERVYVRDQLTVDVSVHTFLGTEGASLAQRWFGHHRQKQYALQYDNQTREQLAIELGVNNFAPLDNIVITAFTNQNEYTLYARRDDLVARVSVFGESSVSGRSREFVAYQVLATVFGVELFSYPRSIP